MKLRGFTLVEMLVVIAIIGILVALAVPNFTKVKAKAKEAEVKQNLSNIQKALEVYSTDNQGVYPPWLTGGDPTDSWACDTRTWTKITAGDGILIGGENITAVPAWVEVANPGDGDALIMGGYLENFSYPKNPFLTRTNVDRVSTPGITQITQRSDAASSQRDVAGSSNTIMWEISGGPPKNGAPLPNGHPGWKYIYPVQTHDPATNQISSAGVRGHSPVMLGNFYYYTINRNGTSWGNYNPNSIDTTVDPSLREPPIWIEGYILVGYGSAFTDGQDVYDVYGEFASHCRTAKSGGVQNQPINAGAGGPDGIPDGVVITLSSGERAESSSMNN